jgi:hypothetical protein
VVVGCRRKEEKGKRREEKKIYPRWQAQDSDHKQQHNNNNKTMTPSGTVQRTVMNLLGVGALPRYDGVGDEGSRGSMEGTMGWKGQAVRCSRTYYVGSVQL